MVKGTMSRDFCLWFFSWISFPPAPEYSSRTVSNFFESSQRYPQVKVHHRNQRHRWQIMGTIGGCRHLKVNVNITTKRCPNKIIKIFLIDYFFHLLPVSTTTVVHLELRIYPWIFRKIWNDPIGVLRGLGETDSWKNENLVALSL